MMQRLEYVTCYVLCVLYNKAWFTYMFRWVYFLSFSTGRTWWKQCWKFHKYVSLFMLSLLFNHVVTPILFQNLGFWMWALHMQALLHLSHLYHTLAFSNTLSDMTYVFVQNGMSFGDIHSLSHFSRFMPSWCKVIAKQSILQNIHISM